MEGMFCLRELFKKGDLMCKLGMKIPVPMLWAESSTKSFHQIVEKKKHSNNNFPR